MRADVGEPVVLADELYRRAREEARRAAPSSSDADTAAVLDASGALAWLECFLGGDESGSRDRAGGEPEPVDGVTTTALSATASLGRRSARDYARAISVRRPLFERVLAAAATLPPTRVGDAPRAPAGTFLHRLAGDPARLAATWLGLPHAPEDDTTRAALLGYRDELVAHGYASSDALVDALPGAICLGVLAELPGFPHGPSPAGPAPASGASLRTTLDRLLDLGDTLTLAAPERILDDAVDHATHDRERRARRLLATHLERAPGDLPCTLELARLERARARFGRARRVLERAAGKHPDDAALATACARTREVAGWIDEADEPLRMPRVRLAPGERERGCFDADTLAAAAELYARHGTLLIEGAFDPSLLESCRAQFLEDYRDYLDDQEHADALRIGDRRFQVSLRLSGAFNDPGFYANPFVLALMHRLLDRQVIVGSTVCATSLPGSNDQHLHKDHRVPFTADADDEPMALPPVAVTTMIPLVALDERIGTTLVRKGSHRRTRRASERLAEQVPIVPLGSCFLMDLALSHRGQGNSTDRVRPIVNMQYTRRWFTDNKNFHRQRPLEIPREEYARIPDEHRSLFDWARQPGPRVDR